MKTKYCGGILLLASSMMMAPLVEASPIYTPDKLLFSAVLGNSGDPAEQQELADFLGVTSSDLTLVDKVDSGIVATRDGAGNWFIDVAPDEPGFFLLKFGTGSFPANTPDTYYFDNSIVLNEFSKLVWTDEQINYIMGGGPDGACPGSGSDTRCNIGRLSHYTLFDGQTGGGGGGGGGGKAPEPNIVALLGIGLLGMSMSRLNKRS